jgi:predicted transcriptional regulator
MKSIIISIKPEQALNILNGNKTRELRKSVPKDFVGWVYGYVTKGKPYLYNFAELDYGVSKEKINQEHHTLLNGTIPFRFWFDEYIRLDYDKDINHYLYGNMQVNYMTGLLKSLQITENDIWNYASNSGFKPLYAWHISKLEVFDKPMVLGDFNKIGHEAFTGCFVLTRPPQSWQYVWVRE